MQRSSSLGHKYLRGTPEKLRCVVYSAVFLQVGIGLSHPKLFLLGFGLADSLLRHKNLKMVLLRHGQTQAERVRRMRVLQSAACNLNISAAIKYQESRHAAAPFHNMRKPMQYLDHTYIFIRSVIIKAL